MKKNDQKHGYQAPTTNVFEMKLHGMLCISGDTEQGGNGGEWN